MANIRIGRIVDDIWQNILDRINGTEGKVQAEDTVLQGKVDTLNAKDFATSAKQDAIKTILDAINTVLDLLNTKDYATNAELQAVKAELATIKANQTSGNQKVKDEASSSGLSANRPQANAVRAGYIYYSVDTDVMEYSNGTTWMVM